MADSDSKALAGLAVIVIDDEELAMQRLRQMLLDSGHCASARCFGDARAALGYLEGSSADVAFVDMRMPGLDGLGFIEGLNRLAAPPAVVVTTAWLDHALEAYGPLTVAYLLKPIEASALNDAIEKARLQLGQRRGAGVDDGHERQAQILLAATKGMRVYRFAAGDVRYFRAGDKHVAAHMIDGERHLLDESLNALVERLSPLFVRVHRNAAVNARMVESVRRRDPGSARKGAHYFLRLRGLDEEIEVSRSHHRQVRQLFNAGVVDAG